VPGFNCTIPFSRGAEEIVRYYLEDPSRGTIDVEKDALEDKLCSLYGS
jgi:hypothetical protein